jgi:hypothetical protein
MNHIEAMKQALEALELHAKQYPHMQKGYTVDAITSLRQAIAEAEKHEVSQEPVAWMRNDGTLRFADGKMFAVGQPFYTHPQPKREPLTDEQIAALKHNGKRYISSQEFARAIEAAHGIKENT